MKLYLEEHLLSTGDIPGAVTLPEGKVLTELVLRNGLKSCLEIGVANGASALALAQAASEIDGMLTGIDPCQLTEHEAAAVKLLERYGLGSRFVLHPQPTHFAGPTLLEAGRRFDLVFVDGMHNFEFKSLDCFYSDRLLRVGGLLALHDATFQSTKKVIKMLMTTGRFEILETPALYLPLWRRIRRLVGALVRGRSYSLFWPNGYANMVVLKKVSEDEVSWDFFQNF
jgi:predicted O-methyltransferase YrrM